MAGLKDDTRLVVEAQLPPTVNRASMIAKIQQCLLDNNQNQSQTYLPKEETRNQQSSSQSLWHERQLREYRRPNGLCFQCGENFTPVHMEVCSKRAKPQEMP